MEIVRSSPIPRIHHPPSIRYEELRLGRRIAGLVMAGPFVLCFALFGIFNLIAGTILTVMASKPRYHNYFRHPLTNDEYQKVKNILDPLKIVGPILLITGTMLVLVGLILGVVACKSVNTHSGRSFPTSLPLTTINGPASYPGLTIPISNDFISKRAQSLSVPSIEVHSSAVQVLDRKTRCDVICGMLDVSAQM
ncbi:uncharacterized protein LOC111614180 [Centruroides sculpturatus]|uniref:uncharacterized protein LOC111614180 n=1 Tax=Centruroides sculpturatus TaxID=218467 RepID=UPI000C6D44B1|nr:uncharacterized protein LOC111614180 [Centruroides sculpturatus]